jgi:hypothetical protein
MEEAHVQQTCVKLNVVDASSFFFLVGWLVSSIGWI